MNKQVFRRGGKLFVHDLRQFGALFPQFSRGKPPHLRRVLGEHLRSHIGSRSVKGWAEAVGLDDEMVAAVARLDPGEAHPAEEVDRPVEVLPAERGLDLGDGRVAASGEERRREARRRGPRRADVADHAPVNADAFPADQEAEDQEGHGKKPKTVEEQECRSAHLCFPRMCRVEYRPG